MSNSSIIYFNIYATALKRSGVAQTYSKPTLSINIFNTINVATDFDNSSPFFIIRKHNTINSVFTKFYIDFGSSPFTNAPITPKLVTLRCSYGLLLSAEFISGYTYKCKLAFKNKL